MATSTPPNAISTCIHDCLELEAELSRLVGDCMRGSQRGQDISVIAEQCVELADLCATLYGEPANNIEPAPRSSVFRRKMESVSEDEMTEIRAFLGG